MELKAFVAPLWKWWWLLLAATLVAGGSSYYASQGEPERYRAAATIMIGQAISNPNPSSAQFGLEQQLARSYANLALEAPVRRATMEALDLDWLPSYEAYVLSNQQLVEIAVVDENPVRAAAVANELANQLILLSPGSAQREGEQERQQFVEGQLANLQEQIEETEEKITLTQAQLGEMFSAREIADTEAELDALEQKLRTLQSNYAVLLSSSNDSAINTISIFEPATVPSRPVGRSLMITVGTSAAIALALAAGAAYLLEYLDDSVRTAVDAEKYAKVPALASVAGIHFQKDESRLITHDQPRSPHAEAFRLLRTNIQHASADRSQRVLQITSPVAGDGKSLIAANLAVVFAQSRQRVLLIDADLRRPVQHKIFDLKNDEGLSHLLLDGCFSRFRTDRINFSSEGEVTSEIERRVKKTSVENLWVLPSGDNHDDPSELLASKAMRRAVEEFLKRFDYVIFDSPPCLAVTDPVVLSTLVDSVFLVIRANKTQRRELQETIHRLRAVGDNLRGIVLNRHGQVDQSYYYVEKYHRSKDGGDYNVRRPIESKRSRLNGSEESIGSSHPAGLH